MTDSDLTQSSDRTAGWMERLLRRQLLQTLEESHEGYLAIRDNGQLHEFGDKTSSLHCRITVHDPAFYRYAGLAGTVGAGEAYMLGFWECDNLTNLVRFMVVNRDVMDAVEGGIARLAMPVLRMLHARRRNTRDGAKKNIQAHYDLGNDLFRLFLDESMMYSSAIYDEKHTTLADAQFNKLDTICRRLDLQPDDKVVEIGTGWGGFALHAAKHYGCHVTTTTISERQYDLAARRIAEAGLSDRITLLKKDYRDLSGRFDKLVSIEMIEAVGYDFLDTYMSKVSDLLKSSGSALIQAITIEDHRFKAAAKSVDFIKRYIFPGSFIPSVAAITDAMARVTDMRLFHLQDIGPSYARTLNSWRRRFFKNIEAVRGQAYPESFIRMWEFYLCYCEGGFIERSISDVHLLFVKPRCMREQLPA